VIVQQHLNAQHVDQTDQLDHKNHVLVCNSQHAQIVLWENFLNNIMKNQLVLLKKMLKLKINWH
jgi:hypothetical protein